MLHELTFLIQDRQFAKVKAVLRKKFCTKNRFLGTFQLAKQFWLNFLVHFLHFWNQYEYGMKRQIFWYPIRHIERNFFSSLLRDNGYLLFEVKNARNRSIFLKMFFNKHVSDFHSPFKMLFHTPKLWNFVKHWSLMHTVTVEELKEHSHPDLDLATQVKIWIRNPVRKA